MHREHQRECKYYRLTAAGRKQLIAAESKWNRLHQAIARVMTAAARA
jgi:PadR family transcriptional regulator PadR